jgi:hypothetical protein
MKTRQRNLKMLEIKSTRENCRRGAKRGPKTVQRPKNRSGDRCQTLPAAKTKAYVRTELRNARCTGICCLGENEQTWIETWPAHEIGAVDGDLTRKWNQRENQSGSVQVRTEQNCCSPPKTWNKIIFYRCLFPEWPHELDSLNSGAANRDKDWKKHNQRRRQKLQIRWNQKR